MRSQICCTVGFLVFFSILFSLGSEVDMYGHFGGMIGGYFSSLALLPGIQQKSQKFFMIGATCYEAYIFVTFLVFFLTGLMIDIYFFKSISCFHKYLTKNKKREKIRKNYFFNHQTRNHLFSNSISSSLLPTLTTFLWVLSDFPSMNIFLNNFVSIYSSLRIG